MNEWRRQRAVRRLTAAAVVLCFFPGAFFIWLIGAVGGPTPEALIALFPAMVVGGIAAALHFFRPARPAAMDRWRAEEELQAPIPRKVEARWSTPLLSLPVLLWGFPAFYLLVAASGLRTLDWEVLALVCGPPLIASIHGGLGLRGKERRLLRGGDVVQGRIRRMLTSRGHFRLKVEYDYAGRTWFRWSDNLSNRSWFGPLLVEERKFVTLLVDPAEPQDFIVYPFSTHEVPGARSAWVRRLH